MSNIFSRTARSWRLIKASARVLNADGELILLPILSGGVALALGGAMVWQAHSSGVFDALQESDMSAVPAWFYGWLFAFYLVQYAVVIFFNVALVGAAIERLEGGDPTIRSALALSVHRLPQIVGFALLSATVGIVLRTIAERLGFLGKLLAGTAAIAWAVSSFLVVPVIAIEGRGPIDAFDRSVELLGKTWGENVIGNVGIGLVLGIACAILALIGMGGVTLVVNGNDIAGIPITGAAFAALGALIAFSAALSAVYAAAVYYYAVMGEPPAGFDRDMVRSAFAPAPEG